LRNFELEGLNVFVDVKMKTTLTPTLSHPMGEGDRFIASKKDGASSSMAHFHVPSPIGWERVRVRAFGI
jgi:hypothetical protein